MSDSNFLSEFEQYPWQEVQDRIRSSTVSDVQRALATAGRGGFHDFCALVSPAAKSALSEMVRLSHRITTRRFGKTLQMYVPLYLSNECQNVCTYCGFSFGNKIDRLTLTKEQMVKEAEAIRRLGYEHVLLVTGEAQKSVGMDYFSMAIDTLKPMFSQISMEVQPLEEAEYRELSLRGVYAILVYQETYHRECYRQYHPKGKKSNFEYRLETPERAGKAGIHKIGLGTLLGLEDWQTDAAYVALHVAYLRKKYWRTRYSISFPRIRPASGAIEPRCVVTDMDLVQLICAYRLFDENLEISLSTRESPEFRDKIMTCGITSLSAGSKTEPGGYALKSGALKQFEISDERSPEEVATQIRSRGYDPVWKDWDAVW